MNVYHMAPARLHPNAPRREKDIRKFADLEEKAGESNEMWEEVIDGFYEPKGRLLAEYYRSH